MMPHGGMVVLQVMHRHALVDLIVGELDVAGKLDVIVLRKQLARSSSLFVHGIPTANSPISTSSMPRISSSSLARSFNTGRNLPKKSRAARIRQVRTKE
jgi:hypothetical protein